MEMRWRCSFIHWFPQWAAGVALWILCYGSDTDFLICCTKHRIRKILEDTCVVKLVIQAVFAVDANIKVVNHEKPSFFHLWVYRVRVLNCRCWNILNISSRLTSLACHAHAWVNKRPGSVGSVTVNWHSTSECKQRAGTTIRSYSLS